MAKVLSIIYRYGGLRLLGAYLKLGVCGKVLKSVVKGVLKGRSAREIQAVFQPDVANALRERYRPVMESRLDYYERASMDRERSDIVWVCWLQGMENAPAVVRACYESLTRNLVGKDIRLVDEGNRRQYVQFPDFIEERWKKKQIPPAPFADLLRLELLIKYGGTWIDSTVLCSGADYRREYLDADLFFFQYKRPASAPFGGISNWFITSCTNNPLLLTLRDMLYAYWQEFRSLPEYFIFHCLFEMIAEARPAEVMAMPYGYSPNCHVLQRHWGEKFDQEKWDKLLAKVKFHKLTYRKTDELAKDPENFYSHVIEEFGVGS